MLCGQLRMSVLTPDSSQILPRRLSLLGGAHVLIPRRKRLAKETGQEVHGAYRVYLPSEKVLPEGDFCKSH